MYERGVPGGTVNLNATGYPDHGRYGDLPLQGKIPTAEPENHKSQMESPETEPDLPP
jgi:hypothetical protein